jgi:hypothetical protein
MPSTISIPHQFISVVAFEIGIGSLGASLSAALLGFAF